MDKTRMWHIGWKINHGSPVKRNKQITYIAKATVEVQVSDKPELLTVPVSFKMRSITPTAAARHFVKSNLPHVLADYDYEANVIGYSEDMLKEIMKNCKSKAATAEITVIKSEDAHLPRRKKKGTRKEARGK